MLPLQMDSCVRSDDGRVGKSITPGEYFCAKMERMRRLGAGDVSLQTGNKPGKPQKTPLNKKILAKWLNGFQ